MKLLLHTSLYILFFLTGQFYLYAQQLPKPEHIVIVIEENHSYDQIINNSDAEYINSLSNDTLGTLFTNFHAETHPSQPNYLYLFSGDNQGVINDYVPNDTPFTTLNLGAALLQKGLTFAGYSEDLPYTGFLGASNGTYKRKHSPWVNWQGSSSNGIPDSLNLPFTSFPSNYDSLPTISFVIPNLNNDMHDGTIAQADLWLKNNLNDYIQWAKTHNSLFVLTFDEDNGTSINKIVTILVGQMIKQGTCNQKVNHINLLRTFEDMYGLSHSGTSADSSNIFGCWLNVTSVKNKVGVNINNFQLKQNYPNPFNPETEIKYFISNESHVSLKVFDILGNEITTLVNKQQSPGKYKVKFSAENKNIKLTSGIYFYKLTAGRFSSVKKMVFLK